MHDCMPCDPIQGQSNRGLKCPKMDDFCPLPVMYACNQKTDGEL